MRRSQRFRSPAIPIAVLALVAALGGVAVAGPVATTSVSKKKTKKIAKKQANKEIDKRLPFGTGDIADGSVTEEKIAAGFLQPAAFGIVNSDGSVVADNSEGLTDANVTMVGGNTLYCFSGFDPAPKVLIGNVDWQSGGNRDVRTAVIPPDVESGCPAGTQASARTTNSATGTAEVVARIQVALFD